MKTPALAILAALLAVIAFVAGWAAHPIPECPACEACPECPETQRVEVSGEVVVNVDFGGEYQAALTDAGGIVVRRIGDLVIAAAV
ncbi:MAG: hypothetical protein ABIF77_07890, partial [bacterium]